MHFFWLFCCTFALNAVFLVILRKLCLKYKCFLGSRNTPYVGGMSFSLAFVICYLSFHYIKGIALPFPIIWIIIYSLILLGIEFIDDLKDFSLYIRVLFQVIFLFLFFIYGKKTQIYIFPCWLNYTISFLWVMGIINAFNHLDVADGSCGGISFIISLAFFLIFLQIKSPLALLFAALSGAILSFNLFNFPPAKVFMGNSGSHFLGFLFAAVSMQGDYATLDNIPALFLPVLVLALPVIDTLYLIVVRSSKRIFPLNKSDDHIVLRYLSKGYSYRKLLAGIYIITAFWCFSGILVLKGFSLAFLISLLIAILATIFMLIKAKVSGIRLRKS